MAGETIRADIITTADTRGFRDAAAASLLAARAAKQLGQELRTQTASARAADEATKTLARVDGLAAAAMDLAAKSNEELNRQLREQARTAAEAAGATKIAEASASGAGGAFSGLATPMAAAVAAGVALAPVIATVGVGLGGLGLAAYTASKNTAVMSQVLGPLKADVSKFSASLQPQVLTAFAEGAKIAGTVLKDIQPVAAATGKALDSVLGQVDAEFQSQTWQNFFGFMARTAGPDVQLLGQLFVDLTADLPPLLENLQPVATKLLQVADATAKLVGATANIVTYEKQHAQAAQNSGGALGFFANAAKRAFEDLVPGTKSLPLLNKALGDVTRTTDTASGSLAKIYDKWQLITPAVNQLGGAFTTYAGEVVSAQQPTERIAANLYVEGQNAKSASDKVSQLNSAWSGFLSLSSDLVTAQLGIESQLQTMATSAKTAGGSFTGVNAASVKLQQDFESNLLPGLQNVLNGMRRAGAGSHDLATVLATDLKPAVDRGALSNRALEQQIYDMAVQAGYTGPNKLRPLQAWIDRNAGSAQNAANKVNNLAGQLAKLPGNKTVTLTVRVAGTGGEYITSSTGAKGQVNVYPVKAAAAGWRVPGSGNSDSVPAMLTPGEAVVPKRLVPAVAPILAAGKVPGFAAGGIAASVNTLGSYAGGYFSQLNAQVLASTLSAVNKKVAASLVNTGGVYLGAGSGSYAADIRAVLTQFGMPLWLTANWLRQIQTESGGRLNAVNLTDSNARAGHPSVGLLQLIPSTFAAFSGPYRNTPPLVNYGGGPVSENAMAQIYTAIRYADTRYGGAAGMAAAIGHGHGYAAGTSSAAPGWALVGERGPEMVRFRGGEQVLPARGGRGGAAVVLEFGGTGSGTFDAFLLKWIRENVRVKGGGSVQMAFGR